MIRSLASGVNVTEVAGKEHEVVFYFTAENPPDTDKLLRVANASGNKMKLSAGIKPNFRYRLRKAEYEREYLGEIKKLLGEFYV